MIDWVNVALNALWIAGLSIIVAAFSYHRWLAAETSRRMRDVLAQPSWKLPFSLGMVLICVGVGYGIAGRWWQKPIWTALALFYGWQLVTAAQSSAPKPSKADRGRDRRPPDGS